MSLEIMFRSFLCLVPPDHSSRPPRPFEYACIVPPDHLKLSYMIDSTLKYLDELSSNQFIMLLH